MKMGKHQEKEYLQGGDAVTGAATVILAMGAGNKRQKVLINI